MDTSKSNTKRLLKCFCGCSDLTEEEVKRIYRLNAQQTLISQQGSRILEKFLENRRLGDKSEAEQMLDIYKKCDCYLRDGHLLTEDEVEEISDLGLPYALQKEMTNSIRTGDKSNIDRCLLRIQGECRDVIEASDDYSKYKDALLEKLKRPFSLKR